MVFPAGLCAVGRNPLSLAVLSVLSTPHFPLMYPILHQHVQQDVRENSLTAPQILLLALL